MKFCDRFALTFCPLVARLVLAASFLWFGFGKFRMVEFTGENARILIELGVAKSNQMGENATGGAAENLSPKSRGESVGRSGWPAIQRTVGFAAFGIQDEASSASGDQSQETIAGDDASDESQIEPGRGDEVAEDEDAGNVISSPPAVDGEVETVRAYGFHSITLLLYRAGNTHPVWMARLAVVAEVVGGIMMLIGLFTRLFGLGLAVVMCFAFYLTTWQTLSGTVDPSVTGGVRRVWHGLTSFGKIGFGDQISAFNQLAHFGLAVIVLAMGAGKISVDHLLFGSRGGSSRSREDGIAIMGG